MARNPDLNWAVRFSGHPDIIQKLNEVETTSARAGMPLDEAALYKIGGIAETMVTCRNGGNPEFAEALDYSFTRVNPKIGLEHELGFFNEQGNSLVHLETLKHQITTGQEAINELFSYLRQNPAALNACQAALAQNHPNVTVEQFLEQQWNVVSQAGQNFDNQQSHDDRISAFYTNKPGIQGVSKALSELAAAGNVPASVIRALENFELASKMCDPSHEADILMHRCEQRFSSILITNDELDNGKYRTEQNWRDDAAMELRFKETDPLQAIVNYNNVIIDLRNEGKKLGLNTQHDYPREDMRSEHGSDHTHIGVTVTQQNGNEINVFDPNDTHTISPMGTVIMQGCLEAGRDMAAITHADLKNIAAVGISDQRTNGGTNRMGESTLIRPMGHNPNGAMGTVNGEAVDQDVYAVHGEYRDPRSSTPGHHKVVDSVFTLTSGLADVMVDPTRDRADMLEVKRDDRAAVEQLRESRVITIGMGGLRNIEVAISGVNTLCREAEQLRGIEVTQGIDSMYRDAKHIVYSDPDQTMISPIFQRALDAASHQDATRVQTVGEILAWFEDRVAGITAFRGGLLSENDIDQLNVEFFQYVVPELEQSGIVQRVNNLHFNVVHGHEQDMTALQDMVQETLVQNTVSRSADIAGNVSKVTALERT